MDLSAIALEAILVADEWRIRDWAPPSSLLLRETTGYLFLFRK
jgi:hypothetical protein